MSFIYEKLPASGEKCLILEPKEALFYPFDFGTGWSTIRLGTVTSFAGLDNPNAPFLTEVSTTIPGGNFYYGFTYSQNNDIPYSDGVVFAGLGYITGASITLNNSDSNISAAFGDRALSVINSFVTGNRGGASSAILFKGTNIANATGSDNFAAANQIELSINRTSKTYVIRGNLETHLAGYPSPNTSTVRLRTSMGLFSFTSTNTITGFYTTNFTETGDLLPIPNKALIYSPFFNNRLRIHNLIVERYN